MEGVHYEKEERDSGEGVKGELACLLESSPNKRVCEGNRSFRESFC